MAASSEDGNEHSGSVKGGEFINQLSHYKLLNHSFAQWS
jgi:hypothetical protein